MDYRQKKDICYVPEWLMIWDIYGDYIVATDRDGALIMKPLNDFYNIYK